MESREYLLSVIIPVYNMEAYLSRCLDSVLSAAIEDMQVIIVDDGSKDASPAICDRYADGNPDFLVIHQENGGLSVSRNSGMKVATGKYIYFLDSDDAVNQDIFVRFKEYISAQVAEPDVVLHDVMLVHDVTGAEKLMPSPVSADKLHNVTGLDALRMLLKAQPYYEWYSWRYFYRRDFIEQHKLQFLAGLVFEDAPWSSQALILADMVDYLPYVGIRYTVCRAGSIVNSVSLKQAMSRVLVGDNMCKFDLEHVKDPELLNLLLANHGEFYVSAFRGYCRGVRDVYRYLKEHVWFVKYSKSRTGKFIYYSTKLLGFPIGIFLSKLMYKFTNRNNTVGHQFDF